MHLHVLLALLAGSASAGLGLLVVLRSAHRRRRIGWLLVAHAVTMAAFIGFPETPSTSRAGMVADQLAQGSAALLFLWLVLIAYLLPDGHPASPRWRRWVWTGLVGVVLLQVGAAGDRGMFAETHDGQQPPVPWLPETASGIVGVIGLLLTVALFLGSIASLWRRTRTSTGDERVRLLWPLWGSLSVPAVLGFGWVNHFLLGDHELPFLVALALLGVVLPSTIAISVLRHRLFDIELVLSRTLTYAALTVLVVGAYAAVLVSRTARSATGPPVACWRSRSSP